MWTRSTATDLIGRIDERIALLERACQLARNDIELKPDLGLAYGGKGELIMDRSERLRVRNFARHPALSPPPRRDTVGTPIRYPLRASVS